MILVQALIYAFLQCTRNSLTVPLVMSSQQQTLYLPPPQMLTLTRKSRILTLIKRMMSQQQHENNDCRIGKSSDDEIASDSPRNNSWENDSSQIYPKMHTMTICLVPSTVHKEVWDQVTKARTELCDPGLFRWPPHANILYPFIDIMNPRFNEDDDMIEKNECIDKHLASLQHALEKCEPFHVSLRDFGTFGGSNRGVLYLTPKSFRRDEEEMSTEILSGKNQAPLVELQSILEHDFPQCNDQKKHGAYTPHMTLSHFPTLDSALESKARVEEWWTPIEFHVGEVYLLKRVGDGGQFHVVATLALGKNPQFTLQEKGSQIENTKHQNILIHTPSQRFVHMPLDEEDWVHDERMKLKERRNGSCNRRRGRRGGNRRKKRIDRKPSKSADTPEEIAIKRAERAAKRERLAKEVALLEQAIENADSM